MAVTYADAIPVFAEPKEDTYNINPANIEDVLSADCKAIIPVHLYGQACEMTKIMEIAKINNLHVIEDNAQAQGSSFQGKLTGSWGSANATSFYPTKNLGAFGDAGAVTTDDALLFDKLKVLRNYGSNKKYFHDEIGYNKRMDEIQAAILNVKLKYLKTWIKQRKAVAKIYTDSLKGIGDLQLPTTYEGSDHVFHLYVIKTNVRDELQNYLRGHGISTMIHYPIPPHLQRCYHELGYKKGDFPVAESIAETALSLPLWPGMSTNSIEYVVARIKQFFYGR